MSYKYKRIRLSRTKTIDAHRLVWIKHNGEIPQGFVIHHIDENPLNNSLENLELLSRSVHAKLHFKPIPQKQVFRACGTITAYNRGCRCLLCKEASRLKTLNYRLRVPRKKQIIGV